MPLGPPTPNGSPLYRAIDAPLFLTEPATALMVKYAANLFHATKIVFANELARIAKVLDVDSQRVMEIFCHDTKLNVEALIGKGKTIRIFAPNIRFGRLMGANRRFIDAAVPHVVEFLVDRVEDVLDTCECIVVANRDPSFAPVIEAIRDGQVIVDLVGITPSRPQIDSYRGLGW